MKTTTRIILLSCLLTYFTVRSQEAYELTNTAEITLANHPSNVENKNLTQNSDKRISEINQGKISAAINILYSILHGDFYQDISNNNTKEINQENKLTREDCDIPDEDELEPLPANREQEFAEFVRNNGKNYDDSITEFKIINISDNEQGYIDAKWEDVLNENDLNPDGSPKQSYGNDNLLPKVVSAFSIFGKDTHVKVENGYISGVSPSLVWNSTGQECTHKLVRKSPTIEFIVEDKSEHKAGYVDAKWKDIFKKDSLNPDGTPKANNQLSDLLPSFRTALNNTKPTKEFVQVESGDISNINGDFRYNVSAPERGQKLLIRSYLSTELDLRKRRFWRSLKRVECFNNLGLSWKKGINKYSDFTIEEKRGLFAMGGAYLYKQQDRKRMLQSGTADSIYSNQKNTNPTPHSNIDQNVKHTVTAVGNQWMCANSWAYAAVGAIEAAFFNKTQNQKPFSVVEMSQCTTGNTACMGGSPTNAYLHAKTYGVSNDNQFFTVDKNQTLIGDGSFNTPSAMSQTCKNKGQNKFKELLVTSFKKIRSKDNDELKAAVTQQPVSVAVVGSDLLEYSSGIIDQNSCKHNTLIDHSVLIIGYDHKDGKDYWIVKNSWGSNWGDQGYMYIERQKGDNEGTCGIALEATYPLVDVMH